MVPLELMKLSRVRLLTTAAVSFTLFVWCTQPKEVLNLSNISGSHKMIALKDL